jgi:NAD(P)H-dependent flavin oxidoreductase YrpB (nitropropane dioxygenase family)
MTEPVKTSSVWQLLDAHWVDVDPDADVIVVAVKGGGHEYVVTCAGPNNMTTNDFIPAMRAAVAGLIRAAGGDMSAVGARTTTDPTFDTGDQRAS